LTEQEWDERIKEAFKRALFESLKDEELPIEPSDFWKNYLSTYTLEDQTKIDLKKSSFKKIGKLLESMSTDKGGDGLILYKEKMKGHKVIQQIYRDKLEGFVPQFKLKKLKTNAGKIEAKNTNEFGKYPKIQIEEVFQLGKNLS